jgi:NAD(P)-dependent dehydrogenase (short-subunit alcohol dehydrogenase family)
MVWASSGLLPAGKPEVMRVVVLGGTGNFGARIVRVLQDETGMEVIAAGRRARAAPGAQQVRTVQLDMAAIDFPKRLKALAPDLVIHCVGPFQDQDYRVAQAALAAGAHYLDLADGRHFVAQFSAALNAQALSCGRVAICGASTLPALSTAVLDVLCVDFTRVDSIRIVIAPGQRAPRGAATLAAVFSYLGRPVTVWREGQWQQAWGWMDLRRVRLPFGTRWSALCDVPDLALLPQRYAPVQAVAFHAALEFRIQHLVLWGLAGLRRIGVPLPIAKWAGVLNRVAAVFDPLGGKWGGMQVEVCGITSVGRRVRRYWSLQAPALHGPEIPTLAAILLARRLANGERFAHGAFPCMDFLTLAEFEPQFAKWGITTQTHEVVA